jgi:hypothetical protein
MLLGGYRLNPINGEMQYLFVGNWTCTKDLSPQQLKMVLSHHMKDELFVASTILNNATTMKRKMYEIVEIDGNYEYVNNYPLQNVLNVTREDCRKNDLVWAAREKDGFRLFSATIHDADPACPESLELKWTDLTKTDLLVNVCYIFPRYRVYNRRIRKTNTLNHDKVEEWLLKIAEYCPPSNCNF